MDQVSITSLAQELKVSEDLARVALDEAQGTLEKAREILQNLLPRFVFIKVRFLSLKAVGRGGILILCLEKGADSFIVSEALATSEREWLRKVAIWVPPELVHGDITACLSGHQSGVYAHDSQKLKDDLLANVDPLKFQFLFDEWEKLRRAPVDETVASKVRSVFEDALSELLMQRVAVDVDFSLYTSSQFAAVRSIFGVPEPAEAENVIETPPPPVNDEAQESKERFRLYLRGQFALDPISGTLVDEIVVGDQVYCEILDRSEIAVVAAKLVGAYRRGLWLPIGGTVVDILQMTGDRRRYRVMIGLGVYIDVLSFTGLMVQIHGLTSRAIVLRSKEITQNPGTMSLVVALVLVVVLIILLFAVH